MLFPRHVALLFAILTLTPLQPADELAWKPEEGTTLTRTFREKTELTLESATLSINGEEQDPGGVEAELRNEREIAFTDELLEVEDGRILKLARTFDRLAATCYEEGSSHGREPEPGEGKGTGELEDATVLFEWDAEDEEFTPSYREGCNGYDDELLEGLEARADLAGFLPAEEVSAGDTWDVEPEVLAAVLHPGGDLALGIDTLDDEDEAEGVLLCYFLCLTECRGELEGRVEAEYRGREKAEDGELATISLSVKFTSSRSAIEEIKDLLERLDVEADVFGRAEELTFDYAFEGEGKLLWDVEANHARSLELEGELKASLAASMEEDGIEMSMSLAFAGRSELTVEVEPAE